MGIAGAQMCREKSFENLKVDSSELVTMATDGLPAGVRVHFRLRKHKRDVTWLHQSTKFKPMYRPSDQKTI